MNLQKENRSLLGRLLIMAIAMFGFGFALVPLYDVFCELTGFAGRTNTTAEVVEEAPDLDREIRIEFMTTVNSYALFEFGADVDSMTVHPGEMHYATFTAKNLAGSDKTAHAVPSVAPPAAAEHFIKIECFCFDSQEFKAGEEKVMPVQFFIDPDLPDYVDTITLGYTYYDTTSLASNNP